MTLVLLASVLFATAAQTAPGAANDIREGKKLFGGMCAVPGRRPQRVRSRRGRLRDLCPGL
jgi:hypothetical protein